MALQSFEKEDWLERVFRKSDSVRSKIVAKTAWNMFRLFCENEKGLPFALFGSVMFRSSVLGTKNNDFDDFGKKDEVQPCSEVQFSHLEEQKIKQYQELASQGDIRSICLDLDRFVQFLNQDHPKIILNGKHSPTPFKKKNPKTIKSYFSFIKSYLRLCHDIKITVDDVKDYIQFPKVRKEQRRPISIETLKKIFNKASPTRRVLYCVLISSGMRLGEALALKVKDLHLDEDPVRIPLDAEITKTKEGRETYISSEAVDKLKDLLIGKNDNDLVFTKYEDVVKAVNNEIQYFVKLRERLAVKTPEMLEKYPNSPRHIVNIHAFRSYFHTKASQKHGSDYANALDGHGAYLKQYYREDPKERAKKYKELEPNLLVESYKLESEKTKDKIIESLQEQMQKLQDKMLRIELLNNPQQIIN